MSAPHAVSELGITTAGLMMIIGLLAGCSGPGGLENGGLPVQPAAGDKPAEIPLGNSLNSAAGSPFPLNVTTWEGKVMTAALMKPSILYLILSTTGSFAVIPRLIPDAAARKSSGIFTGQVSCHIQFS